MLTKNLTAARVAAALLAATAAFSAHAFADDDARRAILELREEVKSLRADLATTRNAQFQLVSEINALKEHNRHLTGDLEELRNQLAVEQRSTRDLYQSLDGRIGAFEPVTVTINGEQHQVDPAEKAEYDAAVLLLQDNQFKDALTKFDRFAAKWPESPYRQEALFWEGTCAFALERYKDAIDSQNRLLKDYPKGVRAPDAMLLVGSSRAAAGNVKAATATFNKVLKTYPESDAAAAAKSRLSDMKAGAKSGK